MHRSFHRLSMTAAALLIGLFAMAVITPSSQRALAQGDHVTVTTQVEPFTSLQINGGGQATLQFGPESSVTIEGNSLVVDRLDAKVENGTLVVGSMLTSALDVPGFYSCATRSSTVYREIHLAASRSACRSQSQPSSWCSG